jgi:hypothetical protein
MQMIMVLMHNDRKGHGIEVYLSRSIETQDNEKGPGLDEIWYGLLY